MDEKNRGGSTVVPQLSAQAGADLAKLAERVACALEEIVEKLGNIEAKIEELSYEVQTHGTIISDALMPTIEECDN